MKIAEYNTMPTSVSDSQQNAVLAPFAIVRLAALPYSYIDALRMVETESLLENITNLEKALQQITVPVTDALFSYVSQLPEDATGERRLALNTKRKIHNQQNVDVESQKFVTLVSSLPPESAALLQRWAKGRIKLSTLLAELDVTYVREVQNVLRPALRAPLNSEHFMRALSFAAPRVAIHAEKETRLPEKSMPDNLERSLLGYLIRSSAKTSPFSSFMFTSALAVNNNCYSPLPYLHVGTYQHKTSINRGVCARILAGFIEYVATKDTLHFSLNSTLKNLGDGRFQALCSNDLVLLGRPWTEQKIAFFKLSAEVEQVLEQGIRSGTWSDWLNAFRSHKIDGAKAEKMLTKLIQRRLLWCEDVIDVFDESPEVTLYQFVAKYGTPSTQALHGVIGEIVKLSQQIKVDKTLALSHCNEKIRALESEALLLLTKPHAPDFHNVLHDDCWVSGIKGEISQSLTAPLPDLNHFLSEQIEYSPQYLRLIDHFTAKFGVDGRCNNAFDFLLDAGEKLVEINEFGADINEGSTYQAPSGERLGVTVQLQIASTPEGKQIWVVNKVFDRPAWLASRFAFGDSPEHHLLRGGLEHWIATIAGQKTPTDIVINGYCNDLQSHPKLTRKVLSWPGEPLKLPHEQTVKLDELSLVHHSETNKLTLLTPEGESIALTYLGSTFPTVNWGIPFALTILSQPFRLMRPEVSAPKDSKSGDIVYVPRQTHGNVVLLRGAWMVRAKFMKENWFNYKCAKRLLAVKRTLQQASIPQHVFTSAAEADSKNGLLSSQALNSKRKPMWSDLLNPFCLSLLEKLAEKSEWISLTETLPEKQHLWFEKNDKKHVSELQFELLITSTGGKKE